MASGSFATDGFVVIFSVISDVYLYEIVTTVIIVDEKQCSTAVEAHSGRFGNAGWWSC